MIIPGRTAIARQIVTQLRDRALQSQPCGVDLTLKRVLRFSAGGGTVDFSNQHRKLAKTEVVPFVGDPGRVDLDVGSYLVEFNEEVDMPLDIMGQIFVRSSIWRSGASLNTGVVSSLKGSSLCLMSC